MFVESLFPEKTTPHFYHSQAKTMTIISQQKENAGSNTNVSFSKKSF